MTPIELGTVTLKSGILVITDPGLCADWSKIEEGEDLELVGPDAEKAAEYLHEEQWGWNSGRFYEVTPPVHDPVHERANELLAGFDAEIRVLPERVPALDRAKFAAERKHEFIVNGAPSVAVSGLPCDTPLPVFAIPDPEGGHVWLRATLRCAPSAPARAQEIGMLGVDFGTMVFADLDALDGYEYTPLEGDTRQDGPGAFVSTTTWGDGAFSIYEEFDEAGERVGITVIITPLEGEDD